MELCFKVSILVPIYQVENYISHCVTSLFDQDYSNIEYVFVNDCTKDNSMKVLSRVLQAYPGRKNQVKIINHEKNMGLSATRNTALKNATGDFVLPVDSDDFLSNKGAVSELVLKAVCEGDDAVFYDMESYPNGMCNYSNYPLDPKELLKKTLTRLSPVNLCGGLYKRSLFIDNNIRSNESISFGEDYAIKPFLIYNMKKIGYINKAFYCYRNNNEASITSEFKISHIYDLRRCIDGFTEFFSSKSDYADFVILIKEATTRCKVSCILEWAAVDGTKHAYNIIQEEFKNNMCTLCNLTYKEYLIYLLSLMRLPGLIRLCVHLKHFLMNIKRKCLLR